MRGREEDLSADEQELIWGSLVKAGLRAGMGAAMRRGREENLSVDEEELWGGLLKAGITGLRMAGRLGKSPKFL